MEIQDLIGRAQDVLTVRRAYGEPIHQNGLTIIPAASVSGGGGGGGGTQAEGEGQGQGFGGGFGMSAKPTGVFVIRDDEVTWRPAIDVNRAIVAGAAVAITALLTLRAVIKVRTKLAKSRS